MDASHYSRPTPSTRYRVPGFWLSFTAAKRDEARSSQNLGFILIVRKAHLAHRLVDEIPVTGFSPCKSAVDYTILTWDIFRSTDPRQSPLSPDSRFASPIQVDRKIASISFTITSNHRSRRSPAKYYFFFFFLNSILSHFSLSLFSFFSTPN